MPRVLVIVNGDHTAQAETCLRTAGFDVEQATSLDRALARPDLGAFDLVLQAGSTVADLRLTLQSEERHRKLAEVAARDAEALYHSFVETLPINLLRKDLAGRFTFANKLFCEELRTTLENIVGKTDEDFFGPELAKKYRADDERVIQTRKTFEAVEEHRLPTGERRFVHVLKAPVMNARSEVIGVQIVFWDITSRVLAEEEVQRKNRDLETLLYVTSHDLREPLRAIQNFANLVSSRYAAQLDARGQDFLTRVVRGAERLDRLLEDVLTLSRVQRTAEPTGDVGLDEVVRDALQQLEARVEGSCARLSISGNLPRVRADRRWVTQAVYNLIANALKFTNPGETPDVEIHEYVPQGNEPAGVGLVVCDRGPGIPAGYAERVFQLFQRAVGRDVEGTGAGLAIVRQIAERHGGQAWFRPREGGGSEFVVTFGLAPKNDP